jgi:hypothetical protein
MRMVIHGSRVSDLQCGSEVHQRLDARDRPHIAGKCACSLYLPDPGLSKCTVVHGLLNASNKGQGVRVRITTRPRELNIEGVDLDTLRPGTVCDVSASVGTWLVVQGYAYPEMRRSEEDRNDPSYDAEPLPVERDRRRK